MPTEVAHGEAGCPAPCQAVAATSRPSSPIIRSRMMNFCILPVTVIGKLVDEADVARDLVVRDLAPAEARVMLLGGRASRRGAA